MTHESHRTISPTRRATGSSTTRWARCGSPRTPSGGRRRSGPWRTSRSAGSGWSGRTSRRWPGSRRRQPTVNARLGVLDQDVPRLSRAAAEEVADGRWDDHFPVDVFQTGSGTSSNMNMNEVLATLATERLGRRRCTRTITSTPASRPTTFSPPPSTSLRRPLSPRDLIPALERLAASLEGKAAEFAAVVKSGRTHLMDATPVTLGQEFGGLRGADAVRRRAAARLAAPAGRTAAGRYGGRHRHQHPARLRRRRHRGAGPRHRAAADRGPRPLRGAGRPGRRWWRPPGSCGPSRWA